MQVVNIQALVDDKHLGQRKQYFVYDGNANVTDIYTVQSTASGGEECIRQQIEYITVSGNDVIQKIDFSKAVWGGAAWDI